MKDMHGNTYQLHNKYAFLKGYPDLYDDQDDDNHIYIHLVADNQEYSVAFNVQSNQEPSNMLYKVVEYEVASKNERFLAWLAMDEGLYSVVDIKEQQTAFILEYDALGIGEPKDMKMAESLGHPCNSLGKLLVRYIDETVKEPDAVMLVFGKKWGPQKELDRTFHFLPAQGMHDVHCNTGATSSDGLYQLMDGALYFYSPAKDRLVGVFCEFIGQR